MASSVTAVSRATGPLQAAVSVREHQLVVDEPPSAGGTDEGPMPTELVAAGLASCMTLAVNHVAAKRDITVTGLEVTVVAERAGNELRYGAFSVTVAADLLEDQLELLVERARRCCWVSNTLAAPPTVEYTVRAAKNERTTDAP